MGTVLLFVVTPLLAKRPLLADRPQVGRTEHSMYIFILRGSSLLRPPLAGWAGRNISSTFRAAGKEGGGKVIPRCIFYGFSQTKAVALFVCIFFSNTEQPSVFFCVKGPCLLQKWKMSHRRSSPYLVPSGPLCDAFLPDAHYSPCAPACPSQVLRRCKRPHSSATSHT